LHRRCAQGGVTFIHDDEEFKALVLAVATDSGILPALVEKDYWVTHTLWALHRTGLDIWFKGGTALSKGYGIIERFSEDVDLCIKPGTVSELPAVVSWASLNAGPIARRIAFYSELLKVLSVPGADVVLAPDGMDPRGRSASYHVVYSGRFMGQLPSTMRPHVLVEVGDARVTPFESRDISSFVHDWLQRRNQVGEFTDNRPYGVRCLHPAAVLIEKLDAIRRRYHRSPMRPHEFIRHYEDAARIVRYLRAHGAAGLDVVATMSDMIATRQIAGPLSVTDDAFTLKDAAARAALDSAHALIAPMFWGPRVALGQACELIRDWLAETAARK
jgi:hypothetical protein